MTKTLDEKADLATSEKFIRYDDSVEVKQPDEDELIEKIVNLMAESNKRVFDKHRHGTRDAHAKSHGILKGGLTIYDNLPEALRQGIFKKATTYPVIIRLSSAPGDIKNDRVPAPFGMAIKVIGVEGEQVLPARAREKTQDFLLVNMPFIAFGDVKSYWKIEQILERHADDPDIVKKVTATLASGANKLLEIIGHPSPTLYGLSPRQTHILGETFYSMAAIRYGDYFGKICAAPLSENVRRLTGEPFDAEKNPSLLRDLVKDFFSREEAEYELRVQLCTDLEKMPVEDASIEWDENSSPYLPIGKITLTAQDTYSPPRRVFADDYLSFNPWHCIEEHRPLGSIMRARIKAYETSSKFRHEMNAVPRKEVNSIEEMPD